jgi:O-antigen ligase
MSMTHPSRQSRSRRSSRGPAPSVFFYVTAAVLCLTLFIGGASRENMPLVFVAEISSLLPLLWAAWRLVEAGHWRRLRVPLALAGAILAVPLLQLIPLPFSLWAALPGHQTAVQALHVLGVPDQWRPYSLQPRDTFGNWLALFPPLAMFLAVLGLTDRERWLLLIMIPSIALISLVLGLMQIRNEHFYFYHNTNLGAAVGLFSNRNHQATLFLITLPLVAGAVSSRHLPQNLRMVARVIAAIMACLMILGLGFVKSRAGILLAGPVLLGAILLILRARTQKPDKKLMALAAVVVIAALALVGAFLAQPLIERFETRDIEARLTTVPVTFNTATHYLPFGSGIGSFEAIYAGVEPLAEMNQTFWNHAHSDYVELWLEAGVLAALIFLAFMVWFVRALVRAWKASGDTAQLARAGAIVVLIVLAHSLVDYPIRTLAIADLFALGLALMVQLDSRSA